MLFGPDPLAERLTLMWHNHFATSNLKVDDLGLMRRQNETLRSLCRAPFGQLLRAMLRDPALLIWLDAPDNTKGHPNENLARELMELFTLGVGPYSEDDVKQAARALTGWRFVGERSGSFPRGTTRAPRPSSATPAAFDADALAELLLDHPATSRRLAWRLCHEFLGEGAVEAAALDALAKGLRDHDLDIGWGVATVLRSRLFFDPANLGNRVSSPIEYMVGAVRALEMLRPAAEHAGAGRLVWAAGAGPVLSAQRRRLARRPRLDHDPIGDRPGELRRRPWSTASRSACQHAARPDRPGRPPRPGSEPVVLRATAARYRWTRGPARCARDRPGRPWFDSWPRPRRSGFDPFFRR